MRETIIVKCANLRFQAEKANYLIVNFSLWLI